MRDDTSINGTTGGAARRYAEIREIGRGGVGRVTLVRDGQIGRDIAMKQLLAPRASGEEVSRFVREAQATGRLEHPNIVPIYDVGVGADGRVYFTMKYVRGESLRHTLRRLLDAEPAAREELGLARLVGMFLQVCNGVAFANAKGYVHRDLKPDNIMLGNFGEVLVADWGLAKDIAGGHEDEPAVRFGARTVRTGDLHTLAGYVYGTPAYMPPEQARGEISRIDQRADVYALGAILYEILTLTAPRAAGTVEETLARAASGEAVERPERRAAGRSLPWSVPKELAAIAMKALSPEPADRYATAKVLADDVQRYVEGKSVLACPDGLARRAWKVARRHRQKIAVAAAIVVVAVTVAVGASALYRRSTLAGYVADAERIAADARARHDAALADLAPADATYVDEADRARRLDANRDFRERLGLAVAKYEDALALDPDSDAVRSALGDVTMDLWRTAEWEDNRELTDLYGRAVERVVPGRYTAELAGIATFRLSTSVEGAESYLFRYVPVGKNQRLVAAPADPETGDAGAPSETLGFSEANRLGALPLERHMRPGEYLVVVRREGFRDLLLPVALPRGGDVALAPALVRDADVPDGFTYVPAFRPKLYGPFPRSKSSMFVPTDVGAFFVQTREVTFGQYEAFLNDLVATGRVEEATARVPRDFGFTYMKIENGAVVSNGAALTPGWRKWPVRGVSWNDAQAYAAWLGARDGRTYRLPTEDEWEAAARGADGRRFSWGDVFWPAAARLTQAYGPAGATAGAQGEDTVYADVSPFGVVDMAGSVAEWCQDPISGGGLGRAAMAGSAVQTEYAIRGNAWALTPVGLETTFRSSGPADYFHSTIGFRLVSPQNRAR